MTVGLFESTIVALLFATWKPPASRFWFISVPLIYTLTTPTGYASAIILSTFEATIVSLPARISAVESKVPVEFLTNILLEDDETIVAL